MAIVREGGFYPEQRQREGRVTGSLPGDDGAGGGEGLLTRPS